MRSAFGMAAAVSLSGCQPELAATRYGPLGSDGGYSERIVEPGVWRVSATTNGFVRPGFARWMALHRSAEIVSAAGFPYLQILDVRGIPQVCHSIPCAGGEALRIWVRGARTPDPPSDCRAEDAQTCRTMSAEAVMAELAPLLGHSGATVRIGGPRDTATEPVSQPPQGQ